MPGGFSPRRLLGARAAQALTSRRLEMVRRRLQGRPKRALVFLRRDDPYSMLLAQCLDDLRARFDVQFEVHTMDRPSGSYVPEPQRLADWAVHDASEVANLYGLSFPHDFELPGSRGDAGRVARGHYMPATIHYGGEWYWGIDRLNHLERRLVALGLARSDTRLRYTRRFSFLEHAQPTSQRDVPTLEMFWSARSPYSYLAIDRAFALADAYGLSFELRPVLPMVMRNLAVPRRKKLYLFTDAVREGRWLGIDIGFVSDPVGEATERCYALIQGARDRGRLRSFVRTFATEVWSRGVDAATDRGLKAIVAKAGLPWEELRGELHNPQWREVVERNRQDLLETGLWGVPTLRFGDTTVWGQDRFWVLEDAIRRRLGLPSTRANSSRSS